VKSLCIPKNYAAENYGVEDVQIEVFLASALVGNNWSFLGVGSFNLGEVVLFTHWIGGSVGPRAGVQNMEQRKILDPTGIRTPTLRSSRP
jgi:hypothetical protein